MYDVPQNLKWKRGETAKTLLDWAYQTAGVIPSFPVSTNTVNGLVKLCGYKLSHNRLNYVLRERKIKTPPKQGNEFLWSERDVMSLLDALEVMRSWLPMHPIHSHKLKVRERLVHVAAAQAEMEIFAWLRKHTAYELVDMLQEAKDFETRSKVATILREKMHVEEYEARDSFLPIPVEAN